MNALRWHCPQEDTPTWQVTWVFPFRHASQGPVNILKIGIAGINWSKNCSVTHHWHHWLWTLVPVNYVCQASQGVNDQSKRYSTDYGKWPVIDTCASNLRLTLGRGMSPKRVFFVYTLTSGSGAPHYFRLSSELLLIPFTGIWIISSPCQNDEEWITCWCTEMMSFTAFWWTLIGGKPWKGGCINVFTLGCIFSPPS